MTIYRPRRWHSTSRHAGAEPLVEPDHDYQWCLCSLCIGP